MGKLCLVLAVCIAVSAQTASLSGMVRNADGSPLPGAIISDGSTTVQASGDGTFTFSGLGPGAVTLSVTGGVDGNPVQFTKNFTLLPGQMVNGVELVVPSWASITGHVSDSAGNALSGVTVAMEKREYRGGTLQYVMMAATARTDGHGIYQFEQVTPGMSYVVAAIPRAVTPAQVAADPKKRPQILPVTYLGGGTEIDGAQPLVVRASESLVNMDFRLTPVSTYCLGGTIQVGGNPGAAPYDVIEENTDGWLVRAVAHASSDGSGNFQTCGLMPGPYRVVAGFPTPQQGVFQGAAVRVTLRDGDDRGLNLAVQPIPPVKFTWEWAGTPPDPAVRIPVAATLDLLEAGAPSAIQISSGQRAVALQDYMVTPSGLPLGYYVKDEAIAGVRARHQPVLPWTAVLTGAEIHFVIGRDGATVGGTVTDGNGNPVPEAKVLILPEDVVTAGALSAVMLVVSPDQNGQFISSTVAPAKYQVLATTSAILPTPECMARILRARAGAQEVEVGPSGTTSVQLKPVRLE